MHSMLVFILRPRFLDSTWNIQLLRAQQSELRVYLDNPLHDDTTQAPASITPRLLHYPHIAGNQPAR